LQIQVRRSDVSRAKPSADELGFGQVFTDHMFVMDYVEREGWHGARVVPHSPLSLDPAAAVFHYAQEAFEGLKAFRQRDGRIVLFRPERNCARLREAAARLCMPEVDAEMHLQAIETLVDIDRDWVPDAPGTALYIRPTLMATEPFLGVRPSRSYMFFVILSPVGAYYREGMNPVRIWVERHYTRAALGGLGAVKAGANYAASLLAAEEAKKRGFAQVLWLDAKQHRYCEEMGVMNLFVRIGEEVITPPLDGTTLGGITRDSVLTLLRDWGIPARERTLSIDELTEAHATGKLREVFGCGTAAVISPVGELGLDDRKLVVDDGRIGELSQRLYDAITGIQYGTVPDPHGWIREVKKAS
jgi:branched-chain amino acid aminotransferase